MQIYPAIDIKNGRAVRLVQGLADNVTDYGAPVNAAMNWKDQGATYLHVVDLDGAFDGESQNLPLIEEIVKKTGLPVELGGGIRTMEGIARRIEMCDTGHGCAGKSRSCGRSLRAFFRKNRLRHRRQGRSGRRARLGGKI